MLTGGSGEDCSIYLYETYQGDEIFYYAGGPGGTGPSGSSFELNIESVEATDSAITVSGRLRAEMARYSGSAPGQTELLTISEALFHFRLPLSGDSLAPAPTEQPDPFEPGLPEATFPSLPDASESDGGGPRFTLPPNYISI